jgi:hypothetical protein
MVTPAARAHRGVHAQGYTSTVSGLEPNIPDVFANVLGGDDRLRLSNYSGKTIVLLGYRAEPYLRFAKRGVYENFRSPNAYLDRFRYRPARAGDSADPTAPLQWIKVADGTTFEWHDHRIHWPKRQPPKAVRDHPKHVHLIFNWRVPARANGKRFLIKGFLGYSPPRHSDGGDVWPAPGVAAIGGAALAAALAGGLWTHRRTRRAH